MESNLKDQGDSLDSMRYIIQFNKRDLPDIAPAHYMNFMLNHRSVAVPCFEAVAVKGVGVLESLNMIAKMVISNFMQKNKMQSTELPSDLAVSQKGE